LLYSVGYQLLPAVVVHADNQGTLLHSQVVSLLEGVA
jgi:hypothetical protein